MSKKHRLCFITSLYLFPKEFYFPKNDLVKSNQEIMGHSLWRGVRCNWFPHSQFLFKRLLILILIKTFADIFQKNFRVYINPSTNFSFSFRKQLGFISTPWKIFSRTIFLIIFTNPSARVGYDTRSIFKRSLTVLNSEFSFS